MPFDAAIAPTPSMFVPARAPVSTPREGSDQGFASLLQRNQRSQQERLVVPGSDEASGNVVDGARQQYQNQNAHAATTAATRSLASDGSKLKLSTNDVQASDALDDRISHDNAKAQTAGAKSGDVAAIMDATSDALGSVVQPQTDPSWIAPAKSLNSLMAGNAADAASGEIGSTKGGAMRAGRQSADVHASARGSSGAAGLTNGAWSLADSAAATCAPSASVEPGALDQADQLSGQMASGEQLPGNRSPISSTRNSELIDPSIGAPLAPGRTDTTESSKSDQTGAQTERLASAGDLSQSAAALVSMPGSMLTGPDTGALRPLRPIAPGTSTGRTDQGDTETAPGAHSASLSTTGKAEPFGANAAWSASSVASSLSDWMGNLPHTPASEARSPEKQSEPNEALAALASAVSAASASMAHTAPALAPALGVPTPVQSPEFAQALGQQITVLVSKGIQQASLQLNPAELGPVSIQITLDGLQAQVHFGADSAVTRSVLEASMPQLASAMSDAGFILNGGGVSQHGGGGAGASSADSSRTPQHQDKAATINASGPSAVDDLRPVRSQRGNVRLGGVDTYA